MHHSSRATSAHITPHARGRGLRAVFAFLRRSRPPNPELQVTRAPAASTSVNPPGDGEDLLRRLREAGL